MLKLKVYALAFLSGLVTILALVLRMRGLQLKQEKIKSKAAEAKAEHAKKVMERDIEIDREFDKRTEDLARDIKKKRTSDELSNPNKW